MSDDPTATRPSEAERRRVTVAATVRLADDPPARVQTTSDGWGVVLLGDDTSGVQVISRLPGLVILGRAVEQVLSDLSSEGDQR